MTEANPNSTYRIIFLLLIIAIFLTADTKCFAYQLLIMENAEELQFSSETHETTLEPDERSAEQEEANKIAKEKILSASQIEPEITAILQSYETDRAELVGLEHRIKSEESLTRKILANAHDMEVSLEAAADTIGDVLRYTFCIEDDEYIPVIDQVLRGLDGKEIRILKFSNYWGGSGYKGINTKLRTKDGFVFELQFHTYASFEAKEEEHANYEIARSESATDEERIAAEAFAKEIYSRVPVPEGAPEYVWNQQKEDN